MVNETQETKLLAIGRHVRVGAARANSMPVIPSNIHAPERLIVSFRIESIEDDSRSVFHPRRIVFTDIRYRRELNDVGSIRVHDGHATERSFVPVDLKRDPSPVG